MTNILNMRQKEYKIDIYLHYFVYLFILFMSYPYTNDDIWQI
jgi:hypothetical protein